MVIIARLMLFIGENLYFSAFKETKHMNVLQMNFVDNQRTGFISNMLKQELISVLR